MLFHDVVNSVFFHLISWAFQGIAGQKIWKPFHNSKEYNYCLQTLSFSVFSL
jgi:hypothetical protein